MGVIAHCRARSSAQQSRRAPGDSAAGGVLPKDLAYEALVEALGDDTSVVTKDLELYATDEPPRGYGLALEIAGVLTAADAASFARFHLVGYSAGGAVAIAFTASHPQRVLSLALLEPAWMGNAEQRRMNALCGASSLGWRVCPPTSSCASSSGPALRPASWPLRRPAGPQPRWMAKRPAGLKALIRAFEEFPLDLEAVKEFSGPVYFAAGELATLASTAGWPTAQPGCSRTAQWRSSRVATTSTRPTAPSRRVSPSAPLSCGHELSAQLDHDDAGVR